LHGTARNTARKCTALHGTLHGKKLVPHPNATASVNPSQASQAPNPNPNPNAAMSPELEQTLSMLSSHRSVLGYMLVTRGHHPSIIRHSGVVFDGEQGKRYAAVVARIVESVQAGLEEVRVDDGLTAAVTGETDVVRGSIPMSAC
jgi:dynein light chain roadblock-type